MLQKIRRTFSIIKRLSFDTHLWCLGVVGGAILLCTSFYYGICDMQFIGNDSDKQVASDYKTIEYGSVFGRLRSISKANAKQKKVVVKLDSDDLTGAYDVMNMIDGLEDLTDIAEFIPENVEPEICGFDSVEEAIEASGANDIADEYLIKVNTAGISGYSENAEPIGNAGDFDKVTLADASDVVLDVNSGFSLEEIDMLARLVQCEASSENIKGRILIANVIINRLNNGHWGDTLTDVLKAPGQVSPVSRGAYLVAVPDALTKEAVTRALNGEDESGGAIYFQKSDSEEWGNKEFLFRYGAHSFYK